MAGLKKARRLAARQTAQKTAPVKTKVAAGAGYATRVLTPGDARAAEPAKAPAGTAGVVPDMVMTTRGSGKDSA